MSRVEPNRNVYVGHRYVPKIFGEWDKQNEYEGLSIVTHKGNSYTSKKRVPVGIDISNNEFWVVTGNYNAQVDYYRDETERVAEDLLKKSDQTYVNTELNKKADLTYVNTELDKKSNDSEVQNEFNRIDEKVKGLMVNVMDYGVKGDGVTDDTQALNNAFKDALNGEIIVPVGQYIVTDSIIVPKGVTIRGQQSGWNAPGSAPEFILRTPNMKLFIAGESGRVDFNMYNIRVTGLDKTQIGIDFGHRGLIMNCYFEMLHIADNNPGGYYAHYVLNNFRYNNYGIKITHSNGCNIEKNRFDGNGYGVFSGNDNGGQGGLALVIKNNGLNVSTASIAGFRVGSSQFEISDNYFEGYGEPSPDTVMIEVTYPGTQAPFEIKRNYFGSHGRVLTAIRLDFPSPTQSNIQGEISKNVFYRTDKDIVFTENNNVLGIEIKNNRALATTEEGGGRRETRVVNMRQNQLNDIYSFSEIPLDTDISGSSLKDISLGGRRIVIDSSGGVNYPDMSNPNGFRPRESGVYKFDITLTLKTTSQDYNNVIIELQRSGIMYQRINEKLLFNPSDNSQQDLRTISFTCLMQLNAGNPVHLKGRGGEVIHSGYVTIQKIDDLYREEIQQF